MVFESAGVADRPLLERLQLDYRVGLVHVQTDRSLCINRVISRSPDMNISHTTDRAVLGRHYDLWQDRVLPTYAHVLSVDGGNAEGAVSAIESLLRGSE